MTSSADKGNRWFETVRRGSGWALVLVAALIWVGQPTPAPAGETPAPIPEAAEAETESEALPTPLQRVAVIGASASCGFGVVAETDGPFAKTTVPADMGTVIEAMLPERSAVTKHCSIFFFTDSVTVGPQLMDAALKNEPTLIVALDYLFWYGYGSKDATGNVIDDEDDRLALLERGLEQLERCACPVIIGDFPNMEDAVGMMLSAQQLPGPETLKKLNERVQDWANGRPNVVLAPLAKLVSSMKAGKEMRIGEKVWPAETMKDVIQRDQLHPTVEGLVLMAELALREFDEESDAVDADDFVMDRDRALERISDVLQKKIAPTRE